MAWRIATVEHRNDIAIRERHHCILHKMGEPSGTGERCGAFCAYQHQRATQRDGDFDRYCRLCWIFNFYGLEREGLFVQQSFPMATAVSDIRLEKPHSLSYQDITRTNRFSITVVWVRSKVELAGL